MPEVLIVTRGLRDHVGEVVLHQLHRRHDIVEIGQRLAHAHHDHIGRRAGPARVPPATPGR